MKPISRLSSGRVPVKSPASVALDRYQLLDLASAEPNLGTAPDGRVLTTNTAGDRIWTGNISINNVTVTDDIRANAVYTENLFYANGEPYITDSLPQITNIFNGKTVANTAPTLIDRVSSTGISTVRWILSSKDDINNRYKSSTIDSINDGTTTYYNEYGIVLSDTAYEVATFTSNISSGNVNLYAVGDSSSVTVTYQRVTLGNETLTGFVPGSGYVQTAINSGTSTIAEVNYYVGNGSQTAYSVTTAPGGENQTIVAVAGLIKPKNTYSIAGSILTFNSAPANGTTIEIQNFIPTVVTGYTGSAGAYGAVGYTGSRGQTGPVGEQGTAGYTGSTGQYGAVGFTGSIGSLGFTGSVGAGYTGSQGTSGYTGSVGFVGSMGTLSNWTKRTSLYNASSGDRIIADTSGGSFTVNLPNTPVLGAVVKITDGYNFGINHLTIGANASTIEGQADDVLVDIGKVDLEFVYDGTTWQVISTMGPRGYTGSSSNSQTYIETTGNIVAVSGKKYIVDTGLIDIAVTLPTGVIIGSEVSVIDGVGNASNHPITVLGNGSNIQGSNQSMVVATNRAAFTLVYYNTAQGWVLTQNM